MNNWEIRRCNRKFYRKSYVFFCGMFFKIYPQTPLASAWPWISWIMKHYLSQDSHGSGRWVLPKRRSLNTCKPGSKLLVLGIVIQPLIGNPYHGFLNPYYWVDDHPLSYGNIGSLDPSTCIMTHAPSLFAAHDFPGCSAVQGQEGWSNVSANITNMQITNWHAACTSKPMIYQCFQVPKIQVLT